MSLLKNLATDASIADEKDSIGGGRVLESGLYPATINLAYVTTSQGGATGLVLHAKTEDGRNIQQTLWMTSGAAKGATNTYTDKDGKKHYLPGFLAAQSLTLLTIGKEISELDTETKVAKVWNKEAKAEVPTKVECLTDLHGKQIIFGLIRNVVDKTVKNAEGAYEPTGETRTENEIDKLFRASDRMTTAEIRAQATEAVFVDTWATKWTGVDRVKAKGAAAGGTVGAPKAAATKKPATSLFAA